MNDLKFVVVFPIIYKNYINKNLISCTNATVFFSKIQHEWIQNRNFRKKYTEETENIVKEVFELSDEELREQRRDLPYFGCVLINKDGNVIGAVLACNYIYRYEKVIYIRALVLEKQYRGKGLGQMLLAEFIKNFKMYKRICLRIEHDKLNLIKWYNRQGFLQSKNADDVNYLGNRLYFLETSISFSSYLYFTGAIVLMLFIYLFLFW